jgi:hypothetical protein
MTRRKAVGDLGEGFIERLLRRASFQSIRDLNRHQPNHPGGDFLATRNGVKYFISVKTRNKYRQGTRHLNGGYNLFPEKVRKAARGYGAVPAWVTIQIDTERQTFCAYFGRVDQLSNPHRIAVPMTPRAVETYECLANHEFCAEIVPELSNQPPGAHPRLSPPNLEIRLLKKHEVVRPKNIFRHALKTQANKIRNARETRERALSRASEKQRKFEEELEQELLRIEGSSGRSNE